MEACQPLTYGFPYGLLGCPATILIYLHFDRKENYLRYGNLHSIQRNFFIRISFIFMTWFCMFIICLDCAARSSCSLRRYFSNPYWFVFMWHSEDVHGSMTAGSSCTTKGIFAGGDWFSLSSTSVTSLFLLPLHFCHDELNAPLQQSMIVILVLDRDVLDQADKLRCSSCLKHLCDESDELKNPSQVTLGDGLLVVCFTPALLLTICLVFWPFSHSEVTLVAVSPKNCKLQYLHEMCANPLFITTHYTGIQLPDAAGLSGSKILTHSCKKINPCITRGSLS